MNIRQTFSAKTALRSALLVSCLALAAPAFAQGTTLNVAQQQDPQNLDPIDTFRLSWGSIGSNIFESLVFRGEDLDDETRIAELLSGGVDWG
ncbi:hypothetical protein EDD52_103331 [Primorskyibacter sedentarius]|uniref:Uncharacterized protein n=1 Tax=Primorskyibacter sedentarius TaxID=745311 RepID=A0A4V6NYL8_9RHOB|nr:hypothetical protein [Primorskyibacter sedentarius]TCS65911.1 hypothetical protein EDD52_103331 [Primorskyibacter sedentarius]